MESHQSSQEVTSHTLKSMASKKKIWEWDRERNRFQDSLTHSSVIETGPGGIEYRPRKEEVEVR